MSTYKLNELEQKTEQKIQYTAKDIVNHRSVQQELKLTAKLSTTIKISNVF